MLQVLMRVIVVAPEQMLLLLVMGVGPGRYASSARVSTLHRIRRLASGGTLLLLELMMRMIVMMVIGGRYNRVADRRYAYVGGGGGGDGWGTGRR